MITLPVSSSVYQSMVANIQQIHTNSDGTLCITPMQVQKAVSYNQNNNTVALQQQHHHQQQQSHHHHNHNQPQQQSQTGMNPLNNNTNTTNANLLQLCRALNNSLNYQNSTNNCGTTTYNNNIHMNNDCTEIKIEKETKYHPDSPSALCVAQQCVNTKTEI